MCVFMSSLCTVCGNITAKMVTQTKQMESTPLFKTKMAKSIPYFRLQMPENDTLWGGTYGTRTGVRTRDKSSKHPGLQRFLALAYLGPKYRAAPQPPAAPN